MKNKKRTAVSLFANTLKRLALACAYAVLAITWSTGALLFLFVSTLRKVPVRAQAALSVLAIGLISWGALPEKAASYHSYVPHHQTLVTAACPKMKGESMSADLAAAISLASEMYQVEPELLIAVMSAESRCLVGARSHRGATGPMQLMPRTAEWLGVNDIHSIDENVLGGAKYLSMLLGKYKSMDLALAAYNAGPGNVKIYRGVPPFKETRRYIQKVKAMYQTLIATPEAPAVKSI